MENEEATTAKKRARTLSILLGTSVFICLVFLTYAVIQKVEAKRQRLLVEFLQIEVELQRKEVEECRKMAEQELSRSMQALQDVLQSSQRTKEEAEKEGN